MKFCNQLVFAAAICSLNWIYVRSSSADELRRKPCRIEVVEKGSGWPVPLVEFRTAHNLRFVTDNAGAIAIDTPDLMGRKTWFHVNGRGYESPKDGFGYRGVRLTLVPGKTIRVEVKRTIIAKRLGRLTGGGLFAECQKLGEFKDWRETGVFGCDSVQTAVYRGRRFWIWGDTNLPHYPLGIFHASAATTSLKPLTTFKPPLQMQYTYFKNKDGIPRGVAKLPGKGPTWLTGLASLPDKNGNARLVASYVKVTPPLTVNQLGLCVWNDKTSSFESLRILWTKSNESPKPPASPHGHAAFWTDEKGKRWALFGDPFPTLKSPATFEAWRDEKQWEILKPQKTLRAESDGKAIKPHSGSVAWNAYRKRWVTVFMQAFGKPSAFGEIWYAEAQSPFGPWGSAVKVLSHDNYTFYNPRIHPELSPDGSPFLLFEGTYTAMFADRPPKTPRYDYNQMLYRLDLDDVRLKRVRD